ncbi:MAG: GIY-YIG nuclease family protein [Novosphingobium sp.]
MTSFGLFWRRDEIDWQPGRGNRDVFRLIGRVGKNRGSIRLCDFRKQQGIYVLYDEYGPCYTGLTRTQGLGKRLKDHTKDDLSDCWDRFSWFGFNSILTPDRKSGVAGISEGEDDVTDNTYTTIADLEALLINLLGTKHNASEMKFNNAKRWLQVRQNELDQYLSRVLPT